MYFDIVRLIQYIVSTDSRHLVTDIMHSVIAHPDCGLSGLNFSSTDKMHSVILA